jgi:hypothetical protein
MVYPLQTLFNEATIVYSELIGMGEDSTLITFKILILAYVRNEKYHSKINKGYLMSH